MRVPFPRTATSRSAIGILAGASGLTLGAWHRLLRRPLPRTSGQIEVNGLEAPVTIGRDRFGVPRIKAASRADLAFGQGFALGQDRLWQLEFFRRAASGRISEFAGQDGLEVDRLMRAFGFRRCAEREASELDEPTRELLEAYGLGIDAAVAAARALPLELQLLRIEPDAWTPADSLVIGKLLALGFSTNMEAELFRADLIERVGVDKAARLEPRYPAGNPVASQPGTPFSGQALGIAEQFARVRATLGLGAEAAGSNNWVVSGERSVTGKPLMAGDPHISSTMPCLWYSVELEAPGVQLHGAAMAGFPGIFIGQSRHLAWTFTNVMADVQDLYVERVREPRNGGRPEYEFEGEWLPLTIHREAISVRGRSDPEWIEVRETHHGPIVNGPLGTVRREPLAVAWTALQAPVYSRYALDVGYETSGRDALQRFSDFHVPCMNMLWADSNGNIGYKLIGKVPIRRGNCPDLPKPGWTGEFEWDGFVPYEDLPEITNPAGGALVTANNRITPPDYPHHITSDYLDGYRAARIEQLLAARERHSLEDFERMQLDVFSIPGEQTAHRLARLRPTGQRETRAIERLKSWDHRLDSDTIAGTIYHAFTHAFGTLFSEAAIGDSGDAERWRSKSLMGFTPMNAAPWRWHARLLELWAEGDRELIGGRDWDELALEALTRALDQLEREHGSDPSHWRWGRVHGIHFAHALGAGDSPLARVLERLLSRRRAAGGGPETVNAIGFVPHSGDFTGIYGPTYRLLADLGNPDATRWQHMSGQSGHPGSRHYDDLMDDWIAGRTNPVALVAEDTLTLTPA